MKLQVRKLITTTCTTQANELAQVAAENIENNMKIDPKSDTDSFGTPASQSRYPAGSP